VVVYLSPLIIARGDHEKVEIEVIEMNDNKITFKATIRVDKKWSKQMSDEELIEYIQARLNSSLGFRGAIEKFKIVKR
jgi:hypothetical protein